VKCPPQEFRNFWVLGKFGDAQVQPQTSYGHGGWNILKGMPNCIFWQVGAVS
jgi:hypothetical protein